MNKLRVTLCLFLFPLLAIADTSSMSFTPPSSDYSVAFLGNLFGVVDGVLHGTGSQIMGAIFTVFNAAVLALGGIVIMYTLIVGTMMTAHEGEMLGKKWSSIWIPIRSTIGLALLIPKSSGYCLMQIFVMWMVVQGVGAADKVWSAALDYLNRGGVIVQATMSPHISTTSDSSKIAQGASAMLAGEVCMLGLQKQLENVRQHYLDLAGGNTSSGTNSTGSGPCAGSPSKTMQDFCDTPVPQFLPTVDAVAYQATRTAAKDWTLPMPNFDQNSNPTYATLNGICGSIHWNSVVNQASTTTVKESDDGQTKTTTTVTNYTTTVVTSIKDSAGVWVDGVPVVTSNTSGLSAMDLATVSLARATAIQQMYLDYGMVAQSMVSNDPALMPNTDTTAQVAWPKLATSVFGVPYLPSGVACTTTGPSCSSDSNNCCSQWHGDTGSNGIVSAAFFNGAEFQNAIADYNAVMMPTVKLMNDAASNSLDKNARAFIANAESQGWLTAGSYFFDLVNLNGSATASSDLTDTNTGLETSADTSVNLTEPFKNTSGSTCDSTQPYQVLCTWFNADQSYVNAVRKLIDNNGVVKSPTIPPSSTTTALTGENASTVYGFVQNSLIIQVPGGQPPMAAPKFAMTFNFNVKPTNGSIPPIKMDCGGHTPSWLGHICWSSIVTIPLNGFMQFFQGWLITAMTEVENLILEACLVMPLYTLQGLFLAQVAYIQNPGVNPIVGLAQMGVGYINAGAELWLYLINQALVTFMVYSATLVGIIVGIFYLIGMILCMPLIIQWMGVMVVIGFSTAYYVPFLPYMIFTFGVIAWLMAVIEAMAAGPIIALGVTHPEGEGVLGKAEQALMILMNVFLRPSMMIIGYIAAIALCYVGVWIINTGFGHVAQFISGSGSGDRVAGWVGTTGYTNWAGMYGMFFSILMYTTLYLTVVQQSFNLIYTLPDNILRWIGGQQEHVGAETARWGEEAKGKMEKGGEATKSGQGQITKKMAGAITKAAEMAAEAYAPGSGAAVGAAAGAVTGGDGTTPSGGGGAPSGGGATPAGGGGTPSGS